MSLEKLPNFSNRGEKALTKLMIDSEFASTIRAINEEYPYWDKAKYKKVNGADSPEEVWAALKFARTFTAKRIAFGDSIFSYNLTETMLSELHEFDMNMGGSLSSYGVVSTEDKRQYLIGSIMEESIASSQIEGAVTTIKKAKEMLRKSRQPSNKSERMIVNNYRTIQRILEIQDEPITEERLMEIHRMITSQTLADSRDEGCFRGSDEVSVVNDLTGEVIYVPPKHAEVPRMMKELLDFFNNESNLNFIHPIVKASILHFMIGYIHPFVDGNGRTARALFYWYLLKNGYWMTEYLSISRLIVKSRNQYYRAFQYTEADENDLTYFIQYQVKTMRLAYLELKKYIQQKITEKRRLIDFQKIAGVNERQAKILQWLNEETELIFTVKEIENRFGIANQTARTDLTGLEHLGFLDKTGLNSKTKGFYSSDRFEELLKQ